MTFQDDSAQVINDVEQAASDALRRAGDLLLRRSNAKSPTLSGEMDATGFVEVDGTEAVVGYDSEYVAKQHEMAYYRHPNGDEPKFLERAADENSDAILDTIAAIMRNALAG